MKSKGNFEYLKVPMNSIDSSHAAKLKEKTFEIYAKTITCTPEEFDATWEAAIAEYNQMGAQESFDERTEFMGCFVLIIYRINNLK